MAAESESAVAGGGGGGGDAVALDGAEPGAEGDLGRGAGNAGYH